VAHQGPSALAVLRLKGAVGRAVLEVGGALGHLYTLAPATR
jgi:hypothetical protein